MGVGGQEDACCSKVFQAAAFTAAPSHSDRGHWTKRVSPVAQGKATPEVRMHGAGVCPRHNTSWVQGGEGGGASIDISHLCVAVCGCCKWMSQLMPIQQQLQIRI